MEMYDDTIIIKEESEIIGAPKEENFEPSIVPITKTRPYEIIALISFILCFVSLALAIVFDLYSFMNVILQFIAALIIPTILFFALLVLFLASYILIFGIYLFEEFGFWPFKISVSLFKEIIGEIQFKPEDIELFRIYRYVLLGLCGVILISAIVSKILKAVDAKKPDIVIKKSSGRYSTAAIVLSILGIIVSIGALVIFSSL